MAVREEWDLEAEEEAVPVATQAVALVAFLETSPLLDTRRTLRFAVTTTVVALSLEAVSRFCASQQPLTLRSVATKTLVLPHAASTFL